MALRSRSSRKARRKRIEESTGVKNLFLRFMEFWKALGNLTLAQVYAFFSKKKDED